MWCTISVFPLWRCKGTAVSCWQDKWGESIRSKPAFEKGVQRSLVRLGDLASAMTEFGGGSNVSATLDVKSANLDACVNQAIHEVGPLAAQKQISVNVELEPPSGSLMFDAGQLEQVLVNLLDNGCKFTPRRGTIEVRGYNVSGDELRTSAPPNFYSGYRIDVSDTGPGIPAPNIEHIFDEYTSYSGPLGPIGSGPWSRHLPDDHQCAQWPHLGQPGGPRREILFGFALCTNALW